MQVETRAIDHASPPMVGRFEQLPKWLNLIPMLVQWMWLAAKYGSITLPSSANPGITSGGLVGDGKREYFDAMGPVAQAMTADFIAVERCAGLLTSTVLSRMYEAGLCFPLVAKPDIGWCGYGVRLLGSQDDLKDYIARFPEGETFLLQRYLPDPGEAGLFYMRDPDVPTGRLIGILLRHYPSVTGNGTDSIADLIARDARLRRMTTSPLHECRYDPRRIPAEGEVVRLSTVASTRVGGAYEDGTAYATPALLARVDAIAHDMGEFLVGRFDVRYRTLERLQAGDFIIMEVNGAGSEAVHAWDPRYSIREAYRIVFAKQRQLFRISAANRRRGRHPVGIWRLARLYLHQQRAIGRYPPSN